MKKIILTGGGTAGHVMPNIGLLPYLSDYEIHYVGSVNGIERSLLEKYPQVKYHAIRTGKFRRSFTFKNVTDVFNVIGGYKDAKKIMKEVNPDVIFSKGGFVSVPPVLAARKRKIPIITHESDLTPGLANKIISRYATKVLTTFPETVPMIKGGKGEFIGSPVRENLFDGDKARGLSFLAFEDESKPVLTIMGGSLGSVFLNNAVRNNLAALTERFNIVHMCGRGHLDNSISDPSYRQFEFISAELSDVLAATSVMLSRAGSNAINEFAALDIPMLLIPLSKKASRGDQILNADSFAARNYAVVLYEEDYNDAAFMAKIDEVITRYDEIKKSLAAFDERDGIKKIYNEIERSLEK